jgi:hypothetical protein
VWAVCWHMPRTHGCVVLTGGGGVLHDSQARARHGRNELPHEEGVCGVVAACCSSSVYAALRAACVAVRRQ